MLPRLQLGIACLALALIAPARAAVTFNFTFLDSGSGFDDPTLGAARRTALIDVANNVIGTALNYTATVNIEVAASQSDGTGFLASAGAFYSGVSNSFQPGQLYTHIVTGVDPNGADADAQITWDFGYNWALNGSPNGTQVDFRSVALHELTHALGFASAITSTGASGLAATIYTSYDSFLKNNSSALLINATSHTFQAAPSDLTSDVFFTGANAVAAFGGPVPVYTPGTFASGSSLSHVDNTVAFAGDVMNFAIGFGDVRQSWSAVDRGVLLDLGYSLTPIPEPASTALSFAGGAALAFVWMRRRRA